MTANVCMILIYIYIYTLHVRFDDLDRDVENACKDRPCYWLGKERGGMLDIITLTVEQMCFEFDIG